MEANKKNSCTLFNLLYYTMFAKKYQKKSTDNTNYSNYNNRKIIRMIITIGSEIE